MQPSSVTIKKVNTCCRDKIKNNKARPELHLFGTPRPDF